QGGPLRSFNAIRIFRGHLERENRVPILQNVEVSVKRVIRFQEFDVRAKKPPQLEYILFGKGKELFLVHKIVAPPVFDQTLSVKVIGRRFTDEELGKGMTVSFPGTMNSVAGRLKVKQQAVGEIMVGSPPVRKKIKV